MSHPGVKNYSGEAAEELATAFDRYAGHFEGDRECDSKWLAQQQLG